MTTSSRIRIRVLLCMSPLLIAWGLAVFEYWQIEQAVRSSFATDYMNITRYGLQTVLIGLTSALAGAGLMAMKLLPAAALPLKAALTAIEAFYGRRVSSPLLLEGMNESQRAARLVEELEAMADRHDAAERQLCEYRHRARHERRSILAALANEFEQLADLGDDPESLVLPRPPDMFGGLKR